MVGSVRALRRYGPTAAGAFAATAVRHADVVALVDERGSLTYAEVDGRSNAVARGLVAMGVTSADRVGLLCRDHRGFVESMLAVAKIGADVVYLNTAFAGPQLAEVADREGVAVLVHDEEFAEVAAAAGDRIRPVVAWHDAPTDQATLDGLIDANDHGPVDAPSRAGDIVILTSGTTGSPK
jgi:acyl-CoA synthetase (AMP-forming)/AMP-acid ligase II